MENWLKRIDELTEKFVSTFGELDNELLNIKPNQNTWSIAQIIQHIIILNESYFPLLEKLKSGNNELPFHAKFGFMVNLAGNLILKSVQPENVRKTKTLKIWEPALSNIPDGIIEKFRNHQGQLKSAIKECETFVKQGTIISSPANKNIVYKLETAFELIVVHEERHFNQAVEVMQKLKK